jgi:hypothetical protein
MPFGLADVVSSTLDVPTFAKTLGIYTQAVVGQLLKGKI